MNFYKKIIIGLSIFFFLAFLGMTFQELDFLITKQIPTTYENVIFLLVIAFTNLIVAIEFISQVMSYSFNRRMNELSFLRHEKAKKGLLKRLQVEK